MARKNLKEFLSARSDLVFTLSLLSSFRSECLEYHSDGLKYKVCGSCDIGYNGVNAGVRVDCVISFCHRWREIMPTVKVPLANLHKTIPAWHAYEDGHLCIEHPKVWAKEITQASDGVGGMWTAVRAAQFVQQATASLLSRHALGRKYDLDEWPREWSFWNHGNAADKQIH